MHAVCVKEYREYRKLNVPLERLQEEYAKSVEIAKYLVQKNASVNARNDENGTALMIAVQHYNVEAVRLLVGLPETEINAQNEKNVTALMISASMGSDDIFTILLEDGRTDSFLEDEQGLSALGYLAWFKAKPWWESQVYQKMFRILLDHRNKLDEEANEDFF